MAVNTSITVDVQNPNIPVVTYASQGDQLSRTLTVTLVSGSSAWTPPTGAVATVRYSKPDGTSGFYDTVEDGTAAVTVSGNVATVKLVQQMTTVAGTVYAQLNWYTAGTNPQRISSFCWRVFVEAAAVQDGTITSSDYYSILTAQIQTCIEAAARCDAVRAMTVEAETLEPGSEATATVSGGTSATNPIHIAFGIPEGEVGPAPTVDTTTITYAGQLASDFTGTPPATGWQSTVPTVTSGNYLWTKTVTAFEGTSGSTTTYGCTKYGVDGSGLVLSVNGQTGAVVLDADDLQYDDTLATHTAGSVGAQLSSQFEQIETLDDEKEDVSNKVTSISSASTDAQYPSAKAVYDAMPAVRYGFRRTKAESSPSARIEYLYDAVGMTPAYMDFTNDEFVWGTWKEFVESVARPVMLKDDGTVDYELDHDDQTKKLDGTASDISNTSYGGCAMVEFGGEFKWVKRYEDSTYDYVIFSNKQFDSDYHAYAHTGSDGTVKNAFYWGMFTGMNLSSKLRSLVGTPMVLQTREVEITYAKNIGNGWHTIYWSGWNYINDLLTLIAKNDNSQAVYGEGRSLSSNTDKIDNGTLKDKGCFYGDNGGVNGVKTLWIENHWGNIWQGMAGCINDNGTAKVKNYKPYCDTPVSSADYSAYTEIGALPSSGYQIDQYVSANGTMPKTTGGSATTYICDYFYNNASQLDYPLVGGRWGNGSYAGSRCLPLDVDASNATDSRGSRPTYIP